MLKHSAPRAPRLRGQQLKVRQDIQARLSRGLDAPLKNRPLPRQLPSTSKLLELKQIFIIKGAVFRHVRLSLYFSAPKILSGWGPNLCTVSGSPWIWGLFAAEGVRLLFGGNHAAASLGLSSTVNPRFSRRLTR